MRELTVSELYKNFPSTKTQALCGVTCSFRSGEIHVLAGENGAGKSTLAKILSGVERPSAGSILVDGERKVFHAKHLAEEAGIAFVPQFPAVAEALRVYEQLMLGREYKRLGFFTNKRKNLAAAEALAASYGFSVDPDKVVRDCSAAEIREVEILEALSRNADCLILDEPTTVLDSHECENLFSILKRLRESGKIVIYISHRVPEILELADRITILESGKVSGTMSRPDLSAHELSLRIAGNLGAETFRVRDKPMAGAPVLEFRNVSGLGKGADVLRNINLELRKGDYAAVIGAEGNGLAMLEDLASGLAEPAEGCVLLNGRVLGSIPNGELYGKSLCYIPSDREGRGLCMREPVLYNAAGKSVSAMRSFSFLKTLSAKAKTIQEQFDISGGIHTPAEALSGGNRQRLMAGRELLGGGLLYILSNPFQGLDGKSCKKLRDAIVGKISEQGSVLFLTSDVNDLVGLPLTQVHVLYRGKLYPYTSEEVSGSMAAMLTGVAGAALQKGRAGSVGDAHA